MEKVSKRILSGVQPSGDLHLGNYLGAIKNFVSFKKSLNVFFVLLIYTPLPFGKIQKF
jgi:tryptophanyl-tRNA synthetase